MLERIKKALKSNSEKDEKNASRKKKTEKKFTFMLTKDDVGKSVTIMAVNHVEAEKELTLQYPEYKVQFLWEWD